MDLSTGRDIALFILIVEAFVLGLVPAVVFWYAIRGMKALSPKLEPLIPIAQDRLARIAHVTQNVSNTLTDPIISLSSRGQQARSTLHAMWRGVTPVPATWDPDAQSPVSAGTDAT